MKNNRLQILILFSAIVLSVFSACKSSKTVQQPETPEILPPVPEKISPKQIRNTDFKTLSANFSTEVGGIGISGQLRMQKDKVIWVSISKIIELARIKLTPDSIYVSIKIPSQAFQGTYAEFQKDYGFVFSFDIAQAALLGNDLKTYPAVDYTSDTEGRITEFSFQKRKSNGPSPELQQLLKMDNKNCRIIFNRMKTLNPQQSIEIEYSNFTEAGKNSLPQHLKVSASSKATGKVSAEMNFSKFQLNQQLTFPIKISKKAGKLNF